MAAKGKGVMVDLSDISEGVAFEPEDDDVCRGEACPSMHKEVCRVEACKSMHTVDETASHIISLTFTTWEEAEAFYVGYSRRLGFGIRRRDMNKNKNGYVIMYKWVCAKEGHRRSSTIENAYRRIRPRAETRDGCGAMFQVNLNRVSGTWYVKYFMEKHGHELVPPAHVHLLATHRSVEAGDRASTAALRSVGVKTSQVVDYVGL